MKNKSFLGLVLFITMAVGIGGCGYNNKVVLPYKDAKTIAVPMFRNSIPPENILTYVAGLESHLTQAVLDDFVTDGNLKITDIDKADLILRGEIAGYEQEPFRFNHFEQVDEYRLFIVLRLTLEDRKTGQVIWKEDNFSGDTQYFINGPRAIQEEQAAEKAILDMANKIVNRVVEDW